MGLGKLEDSSAVDFEDFVDCAWEDEHARTLGLLLFLLRDEYEAIIRLIDANPFHAPHFVPLLFDGVLHHGHFARGECDLDSSAVLEPRLSHLECERALIGSLYCVFRVEADGRDLRRHRSYSF